MAQGYYGIIAWDSPKGGDWRRLWESPTYKTETRAKEAIALELARGKYPYKGTTMTLHYREDK